MATQSKFRLKNKQKDSYFSLITNFPLSSIKSDEHLKQALIILDELTAREKLDDGEELYLDALSDLVEVYENAHVIIEAPTDADILRHLMDAKGINQAELHRQTGLPKSTISEVLSGKKTFSKKMISQLASFFNVNVSILAANI